MHSGATAILITNIFAGSLWLQILTCNRILQTSPPPLNESVLTCHSACEKNNFTEFFVFYRRTRHFVESRSLCLSEFVACRREKNR
jgi:hypothetical protein